MIYLKHPAKLLLAILSGFAFCLFVQSLIDDKALSTIVTGVFFGIILISSDYDIFTYIGAFIAMGAEAFSFNLNYLLPICFLAVIVWIILEKKFQHFGGKLGLVAFMSSAFIYGLKQCLN